mmetsp:Transcript_4171/g.5837  ORF Transcript_4171/g.5837 Transcript_4171/m.5837 type:complete len:525 (+) Transcript_4171:156-1730(+)
MGKKNQGTTVSIQVDRSRSRSRSRLDTKAKELSKTVNQDELSDATPTVTNETRTPSNDGRSRSAVRDSIFGKNRSFRSTSRTKLDSNKGQKEVELLSDSVDETLLLQRRTSSLNKMRSDVIERSNKARISRMNRDNVSKSWRTTSDGDKDSSGSRFRLIGLGRRGKKVKKQDKDQEVDKETTEGNNVTLEEQEKKHVLWAIHEKISQSLTAKSDDQSLSSKQSNNSSSTKDTGAKTIDAVVEDEESVVLLENTSKKSTWQENSLVAAGAMAAALSAGMLVVGKCVDTALTAATREVGPNLPVETKAEIDTDVVDNNKSTKRGRFRRRKKTIKTEEVEGINRESDDYSAKSANSAKSGNSTNSKELQTKLNESESLTSSATEDTTTSIVNDILGSSIPEASCDDTTSQVVKDVTETMSSGMLYVSQFVGSTLVKINPKNDEIENAADATVGDNKENTKEGKGIRFRRGRRETRKVEALEEAGDQQKLDEAENSGVLHAFTENIVSVLGTSSNKDESSIAGSRASF